MAIIVGYIVPVIHVFACLFLIVVVLLQTGKGADMGAVFGGGSQTLFGSGGAGNLLTKLTTGTAIAFMITSLILSYAHNRTSGGGLLNRIPTDASAPAAPALPPTAISPAVPNPTPAPVTPQAPKPAAPPAQAVPPTQAAPPASVTPKPTAPTQPAPPVVNWPGATP
jgi:preprotein translocase subunit SecG